MLKRVLGKIIRRSEDAIALEELKSAINKAEIFLITLNIGRIDEKDFESTKKGCENMLVTLNPKMERMEKTFHKNLEQGTRLRNCERGLENAREVKQNLEKKIAELSTSLQRSETT